MRVERVKRYGGVGYPSKPQAQQDPKLLASVPTRWQSKPIVLAALSSLVGCTTAYQTQLGTAQGKAKPFSLVAPLFIHGDGHGTFGCRAINPPEFLTEAEAREVIFEEAKKSGLAFKPGGAPLEGVSPPLPAGGKRKVAGWVKPDGSDAKRGIRFVFVSEDDALNWGSDTVPLGYTLDVKDTAKRLAEQVGKAKPKGVVATFYDPLVLRPSFLEESDGYKKARIDERLELRKQVRDFVKWLKSQGVI